MTAYREIRYPRTMALVAILLASINLRTSITALSPLLPRIEEQLGMGGTVVGLLGTIPTAMFALSAFVLPTLKRRFTLSEMMLVSAGFTALGQLLRVAYPSQWILLAGTVIALFALGILNATMPLVVREYFPRHVAGMSTTYMLTSQVSLTVAPLLAVPVADFTGAQGLPGWQTSLGLWGLCTAVAAVAWLPLLIHRGPNPIDEVPEPNFSTPVWRTKVGLGMAFMFGSNSFVAYTFMTFLPQIYTEQGTSEHYGAGLLSVFSGVGIVVTFLGPWLAARLNNLYPVIVFTGLCFIIAPLGFAFAPLKAPVLWASMAAIGTIMYAIAMVLVNFRARTLDGATGLASVSQGVGYTIASVGPFLTGALHQVTGSFTVPLIIMSPIGIVTLIAGYFATRQVYVEDQIDALKS